jgi:hypothetical protein
MKNKRFIQLVVLKVGKFKLEQFHLVGNCTIPRWFRA